MSVKPGSLSRRGAGGLGGASVVAAATGYLVLLVAARTLSTADNADFLAYWGLLFFFFGVLGGVQSETTRAVHEARTAPALPDAAGPVTPAASPPGPRTRVVPVSLGIGAALGAVTALTAPLWGRAVLGDDPAFLVALVALATVAFAGHSATLGTLAGSARWGGVAWLMSGEGVLRLALTLGAAATAAVLAPQLSLPAAAAAGALAWVLAAPATRGTWGATVPGTPAAFAGRVAQAMAGAASSAALLVGFPVLLRLTTSPEDWALAAPIVLAVQLTRAPLMIPLGAFQGVAITHFLDRRTEGVRPLLRILAVIGGVGVVGAGAAAVLGPWIMTVFGADYRVGAATMAGLTVAAGAVAALTLTGAAVLALGRHRTFAAGWLTALVAAVAVLLTPAALAPRTVAALVVGPLLGAALHLIDLARHARR